MRVERLGPFLLRQPPGVFPLGEDALRLEGVRPGDRKRLSPFAAVRPDPRTGAVRCGAGPRGRLCCPGQFGGERAGRDGLGRGLERADRWDGPL